jgi:hypothetical protein
VLSPGAGPQSLLGNHAPTLALSPQRGSEEAFAMGKGILLWLLGVPIPVIILLWLFFGH